MPAGLLLASILLVDRTGAAGIHFENTFGGAEKRWIYETLGSGAAFFDYDEDGDLDVYLVNASEELDRPGPPNRLFRNAGDGTFEDVTESSGTGDRGFGVAVAVADVDDDGDLDLFVANDGPDVLFLNEGDGAFRRVDFDDELMAGGAAFGDVDADGLPDLYVSSYVDRSAFEPGGRGTALCNWKGLLAGCGPAGLPASPDRLYRNVDGRFHDASKETGVGSVAPSYGLGVLFSDLDGDGRADLYVANDGRPNFFFRNRGDGTFSEEGLMRGAAYSGDGREQAGMGVDADDIDGDGDPDLVVTNFSHDHTVLYENLGSGFFADASYRRGIGKETYFPLSWGVRFVDLDNDGARDLFVANGHIYPKVGDVAPETAYAAKNDLFRNDGAGNFSTVEGPATRRPSRGLAAGDYDGDGRVDLLVTTMDGEPELLHNETPDAGASLSVRLVGTRSTRDGLGAAVTLVMQGGERRAREARTAGSYASSQDVRVHFGLGEGTAQSLEVRWPSGIVDSVPASDVDSVLIVKEGFGLLGREPFQSAGSR